MRRKKNFSSSSSSFLPLLLTTTTIIFLFHLQPIIAIAPMGNIRRVGKIAPIADIDEMPGTEGYDAETGIISPNKKCTCCVFLNDCFSLYHEIFIYMSILHMFLSYGLFCFLIFTKHRYTITN